MSFDLVDRGWERCLLDAMRGTSGKRLRIICPFIKRAVVDRLLAAAAPGEIEVLTRFDTRHFVEGVSDADALALLLRRGARVRGVKNLHAKVYLFGAVRAVVTSANLTLAALRSNHEFGFASDDSAHLRRCEEYFEALWSKAGPDLTAERVEGWLATVERHRTRGAPPLDPNLGDEGVDVGIPDEEPASLAPEAISGRAFVKFFGTASNRADRSLKVAEEVKRAGCHWACSYPRGKRPRQPEDGSPMFMARLVRRPDDAIIFGRAIALRHVPGRDDATPEDILVRDWKEKWPHYVRVHGGKFLAGDLTGGVSLRAMMSELASDAFVTTQRNENAGAGNTDPRRAYMRRADVELSPEGHAWLARRLDEAFRRNGVMSPSKLRGLDWPEY